MPREKHGGVCNELRTSTQTEKIDKVNTRTEDTKCMKVKRVQPLEFTGFSLQTLNLTG